MTVNVIISRLDRRRPAVSPVPMEIDGSPDTAADLITLCVRACAARQRRRTDARGETVLSQDQIDDLAVMGKIAFGADPNGTPADESAAVANALQSYEDGLFRVFVNGKALGGLSEPVSLSENDTLTFLRLTMLSGPGW